MAGAARRHRRLGRAKRERLALPAHWHSKASKAQDLYQFPRLPRPPRRWRRLKTPAARAVARLWVLRFEVTGPLLLVVATAETVGC